MSSSYISIQKHLKRSKFVRKAREAMACLKKTTTHIVVDIPIAIFQEVKKIKKIVNICTPSYSLDEEEEPNDEDFAKARETSCLDKSHSVKEHALEVSMIESQPAVRLDIQTLAMYGAVHHSIVYAMKVAGRFTMRLVHKASADKGKQDMIGRAREFLIEIRTIVEQSQYIKDLSYMGILLDFHLKKHNYTSALHTPRLNRESIQNTFARLVGTDEVSDELAECVVNMGLKPTVLINCAAIVDKSFESTYQELYETIMNTCLYPTNTKTPKSVVLLSALLKEIQRHTEIFLEGFLDGIYFGQEELPVFKRFLPVHICSKKHLAFISQLKQSALSKVKRETQSADKQRLTVVTSEDLKEKTSPSIDSVEESPAAKETNQESFGSLVQATMGLIVDLKGHPLFRKQREIYLEADDFSNVENPRESLLKQDIDVNKKVMAHIQTQHRITFRLYELSQPKVNSK